MFFVWSVKGILFIFINFYKSVFVQRLIGELLRIITYNPNILLSAQQTVVIFKVFGLLKYIIDKSKKKVLKTLLRQNYQEEFK